MIHLRPGQALSFWYKTMLSCACDDNPDLTVRQMAILLTVYLDPPPHTVRGLAQHLGVTKPVITRALDTMGTMGFVSRRRDEKDRRNVLVQRTVKGSEYLEQLSTLIIQQAESVN